MANRFEPPAKPSASDASFASTMHIRAGSRNIPSLDGLRAISILLVLIGHSSEVFSRSTMIPERSFLYLAHTGVMVFFVISGFLITNLLLQELHTSGDISLRRFYLRRAFRIFPPFYVYLGIIFVLALAGVFHTPLRAFFFAGIYTSNYYLGPGAGFVGVQHIWSLSIEEQFYLLWPAALLLMGKRRSIYFATVLILISPFSRLVTYQILAPENRAMVNRMFHSSVDTIMFGCLLALVWRSDRFNRFIRHWTGSRVMAASVLFLLVADPMLDYQFHGGYNLLAGMTLEGIAICLVILHVVRRPEGISGRVLNAAPMRHIGIVSYSLYLWQNIIIGEAGRYFPLDLIAVLACAEASYWIVERPSFRLRDRLGKRWKARRLAEPQPLT